LLASNNALDLWSWDKWSMPFEYLTDAGALRLLKKGDQWTLECSGSRHGEWTSPDDAKMATVRHGTGWPVWGRTRLLVSDDLLRWRPGGENL
jgi:hypothetical protein